MLAAVLELLIGIVLMLVGAIEKVLETALTVVETVVTGVGTAPALELSSATGVVEVSTTEVAAITVVVGIMLDEGLGKHLTIVGVAEEDAGAVDVFVKAAVVAEVLDTAEDDKMEEANTVVDGFAEELLTTVLL